MNKKVKKNQFSFEHKNEALLPLRLFYRRTAKHLLIGFAIIFLSLMLGVIGYHFLEEFNWTDSLLNASMILGGMGPVGELKTDSGKIFASMYALFSGIVFLITVGIIIAPTVHRFLHKLHIDEKSKE
ncbi:MAG: hypothetical protein CVV24_03050 [Ignavibacteriae bacterium HGW-Ignavibacteriae-3]|nr:MAG: hypothetical protein CVV24_03050 [Ignavibacteriae bacterium HGW-Ignavibacteriae-3]